jgi:hypothetical protein
MKKNDIAAHNVLSPTKKTTLISNLSQESFGVGASMAENLI